MAILKAKIKAEHAGLMMLEIERHHQRWPDDNEVGIRIEEIEVYDGLADIVLVSKYDFMLHSIYMKFRALDGYDADQTGCYNGEWEYEIEVRNS